MQEVGSPEAIEDLVAKLGAGWNHVLADPDGRGIRVGFLTRLPIKASEQIPDYAPGIAPVRVDDKPTPSTTTSLQITVTTAAGRDVQLISCHFKSKLLEFPHGFEPDNEDPRARYADYALGRRTAEASTIRIRANELLDGHGQDRPVIVLGDLNDTEYSASTTTLQGPGGSEIGTGGFDHPDKGDAYRMWNLGLKIPADQRFSWTYQGRKEFIDHIFAPTPCRPAWETSTPTTSAPPPSVTSPPTTQRTRPRTTVPSPPTSPTDRVHRGLSADA